MEIFGSWGNRVSSTRFVDGVVDANSGGNTATGGSRVPGGGTSIGGTSSTGGSKATGGNASSGGSKATGGQSSSGGALNACGTANGTPSGLPRQSDILSLMRLSNTYFTTNLVPDPTQDVTTNPVRASTLWTRAVYFEGLMGLYGIETDTTLKTGYYNCAVTWGAGPAHPWQLYGGSNTTRDANSQCCGQTYMDLYKVDTSQTVRIQKHQGRHRRHDGRRFERRRLDMD